MAPDDRRIAGAARLRGRHELALPDGERGGVRDPGIDWDTYDADGQHCVH